MNAVTFFLTLGGLGLFQTSLYAFDLAYTVNTIVKDIYHV